MNATETRLLKEIVHKIALSFTAVDSIALTIKYTDGVSDTYNFGGNKTLTWTEQKGD